MKQPDLISRAPPALKSMQFERLLEAGLLACQQLAGEHWTDYNEHDPGVTILEQLSYALTDVGYRVNYPVPDLLAPAGEAADPARHSTLFPGDVILSCQPLTALDYRKLLYDRVGGLKNVWLEAAEGRPGLYKVLLDRYEDCRDTGQLVRAVRAQFQRCRNLGEDLAEVVVLEPFRIEVGGRINIAADADPARVLAAVLFGLQSMLTPSPAFGAVGDLLRAQAGAETVFDGPLLELGVLRDEEMGALRRGVSLREIRASILAVPAVRHVQDLVVRHVQDPAERRVGQAPPADGGGDEDAPPPDESAQLTLGPRQVFALRTDGAPGHGLEVLWKGRIYPVDMAQVRRHMDELGADRAAGERLDQQRERGEAYRRLERGQFRDPERYYSIQHQFPLAYGLGSYGVPEQAWLGDGGAAPMASAREDAAAARRQRLAQARQLKAYLLFFEQILANHFSQVANLGRLFSTDPALDRSYFFQPLAHPGPAPGDPPDIASVLLPAAFGAAEPAPPAGARYVVQVMARHALRHAREHGAGAPLLRSREARSAAEAGRLEGEILLWGQLRAAYRRKRMRDGRIHIVLRGREGAPLAFGARPFVSRHAAKRAIAHMAAWMRRLAVGDAAARRRYLTLRVSGAPAPVALDPLAHYIDGLGKLVDRFDPAVERRHQFLDHLLARFNERFEDEALARVDPRPAGEKEDFRSELAGWKAAFLEQYAPAPNGEPNGEPNGAPGDPRLDLGGRRSLGCDYTDAGQASRSGLERRLRLLLGIGGVAAGSEPRAQRHARPAGGARRPLVRQGKLQGPDEVRRRLGLREDDFVLTSAQPVMLDALMREGTVRSNYRIVEGAAGWRILFRRRSADAASRRRGVEVARAPDKPAARAAVAALISCLNELSGTPEDIYDGEDMTLLEHILLRPRAGGAAGAHDCPVCGAAHAAGAPGPDPTPDDFYEYRVSLVFPAWPARFQRAEFRSFAARSAAENCPAHLALSFHWLGARKMRRFGRLHRLWRARLAANCKADAKDVDLDALNRSARRLREFMGALDQGERAPR